MGTKAFALSAIVAVSLAVTGSHPANAQSYPERLIKIVVPFPAGGPSDVAARLVTQPLSSKLGQSVIMENLPGAGGRTGAKAVAQASPDGYTLLLGGTNPNAIAQSLYRNLNFEPLKDFTAVALIGELQRAGGQPLRARENAAGTGAIREGKPRQAHVRDLGRIARRALRESSMRPWRRYRGDWWATLFAGRPTRGSKGAAPLLQQAGHDRAPRERRT